MQKEFEWTKSFYSSREDVKNINIVPAISYILSGIFFATALVFLIGGGAALINRHQSIVLMLVFFPSTVFMFLVAKLAQKVTPDVSKWNSTVRIGEGIILVTNKKDRDETEFKKDDIKDIDNHFSKKKMKCIITMKSNKYITLYNIKEDEYKRIKSLLGMKK